jgi:small subunit ribosomal protein S17
MKTLQGTVTAAKMTQTVTVTVHRLLFHPKYKKRFRISKKFLADTEKVQPNVGDLVEITECRPLSKRKHFMVTSIVKKAAQVAELKEEAAVAALITPKTDEKTSEPNA